VVVTQYKLIKEETRVYFRRSFTACKRSLKKIIEFAMVKQNKTDPQYSDAQKYECVNNRSQGLNAFEYRLGVEEYH